MEIDDTAMEIDDSASVLSFLKEASSFQLQCYICQDDNSLVCKIIMLA